MKANGRENSAVVEFNGKVQRIAPNAKDVQYAKRQLLGLNIHDIKTAEELIFDILVKGIK
jgi:hypothetical protein